MEKEPTAILQHLYIGEKEELEKVKDVHLLINCTVDIPFPKYPVYPIQLRIPIEEDKNDKLYKCD